MQPKHKGNYKPGTATPKVLAMGKIDFHGNIIPNTWYDKLKFESGKTDSISILILSEIVYWYRPTEIRSEKGGEYSYNKKFRSDMLQKSYKDLSSKFGFSVKQIRESFKRLEDQGLIKRVLRTLLIDGAVTPNMMFIDIFPDEIQKLTLPSNTDDYLSLEGNTSDQNEGGHSLEGSTLFTSKETPCCPPGKDNIQRISTEITSKITEEGNPPKPACSLDSVDAFASSVIPEVSPSPHPGYADRHSEDQIQDCSQGQEVTQENSKQAELSVGNAYGQPVDGGNSFFPGPPEVLLKQDKILGVDSSVSFSGQGISQEFNADNCQSEVKSQIYQNTEVERSDVFNASARCDRQFMKLMPSMELAKTDRQWLKADGGQRLLARMKSMGIELTQWWEVLDYWHKEHQLWAWRNQEGFSMKTDLEKRRRIKEAFAGWSKKPDNTNTLDEDLECFKSRLRRADDTNRTNQQVRREEDPTRRPRTEEELAEIIAIFQANKPTW